MAAGAVGYDTVFINPIDDGELVRIAAEENRIILTADTGIMQRRVIANSSVAALKVELGDWKKQLRAVAEQYQLDRSLEFTRCLVCNADLISLPKSDEEALKHVPPNVAATQKEFKYCPHCRRYYWKGSHWQRMTRLLSTVLEDQGNGTM